jgi:GNAT superfamily N-acetyltransferase
MIIIRARAADAAAVADIYLRAREAAGSAMPPGVHPPDDVRDHVTNVLIPKREVWIASENGLPVGVLVLDGADLDWLFVTPEAQSRGVGSALLDHAKAQRPGGLALWTFVSNAPARRFYEHRGFVEVARTDGVGNEEGAPDIRFAWGGGAGEVNLRTDASP